MTNSSADKKTILYVSGFSDIVGGGQRSFFLILKGLDRSRYIPIVLCPEPGEVSRAVSAMGIETLFLKQPKLKTWRFWRAMLYAAALRRAIRAAGVRLVHCDTLNSAFLSGLAALRSCVPVVFHARVAGSGGVLDRLVPFFCDIIICVSQAVAGRFQGAGGKVRVIYNGVNTSDFNPELSGAKFREANGIPLSSPLLGYCGQLMEAKGLAVLVDAFAAVKKTFPAARLALAGRGDFEVPLRAKVKELNLTDSVVFAGFTDDIPGFMAALDVMVLPSFWLEGLSRVLLEAMACGKPVVATTAGGNIETVVDGVTGYFFPAGSAELLAEQACALLQDKELARKMGESGRKRAVEMFSIQRTSREIDALYKELLRK